MQKQQTINLEPPFQLKRSFTDYYFDYMVKFKSKHPFLFKFKTIRNLLLETFDAGWKAHSVKKSNETIFIL